MAVLVSKINGNWGSAASWAAIETGSGTWNQTLAAQESSTTTVQNYSGGTYGTVTASGVTVDAVLFKFAYLTGTGPFTGTVTMNIKSGSTVVATTSFNASVLEALLPNGSSISSSKTWIAIELATPYTFTAAAHTCELIYTGYGTGQSITVVTRSSPSGPTFSLRTTTTGTPAAGDQVVVAGVITSAGAFATRTISMDPSAITIGPTVSGAASLDVSCGGILRSSAAASTTYTFTSNGNIVVNEGGTLEFGSAASPIPASSTLTVSIPCASANQFGFYRRGGAVTFYGASKVNKTFLAANASAGATSITTADTTNWLSGDSIVIATTTKVSTQTETKTLSGAASGTTVPVAALTYAHTGSLSSNVPKAEIANLTRNVVFTGTSEALGFRFDISGSSNTASSQLTQFYNTEIRYFNTVSVSGTTADFKLSGSSFARCNQFMTFTTLRDVEISNSVVFPTTYAFSINTSRLVTISDSVFIQPTTQYNPLAVSTGAQTVSITNCQVVGGAGLALYTGGSATVTTSMTVDNLIAHGGTGSSQSGIQLGTTGAYHSESPAITISNSYVYMQGYGLYLYGNVASTISNCIFEGNETNVQIYRAVDTIIKNCTIRSISGYTSSYGVYGPTQDGDRVFIDDCVFGGASANDKHSSYDVLSGGGIGYRMRMAFRNCSFSATASASPVSIINVSQQNVVSFVKYNQISNDNRAYLANGRVDQDFQYSYLGAGQGSRMYPSQIYYPLATQMKTIAVPAGKKARVSVFVRKGAASDATAKAFTANGTTTLTSANHGFKAGDLIKFTSTGTASGLTINTNYYVQLVTTNTFSLSTSASGSAITVGAGTATLYATMQTLYGGSELALIVRRNYYAGIANNTTLATSTAASMGAWEQLMGETATVTEDSLLEIFAQASTTATASPSGYITLDAWSVEIV